MAGSLRVGAFVQARHRGEQVGGVGQLRALEQHPDRPALDHPPAVHDHDLVAHLGDHAHVVGDEQDGDAELVAQAPQQPQDLRLDGDVEGRGRLVGDEQRRGARQRDGDDTRWRIPPENWCG
jgi:hypothetical protein